MMGIDRYSIWLDSKLRLEADPLLILENFLWRGKHEYAISNHYDRHCVWEEVTQNKKLNKFNHSIIDEQFRFYQREGLPRFNRSDPNRYLPSRKSSYQCLLCIYVISFLICKKKKNLKKKIKKMKSPLLYISFSYMMKFSSFTCG